MDTHSPRPHHTNHPRTNRRKKTTARPAQFYLFPPPAEQQQLCPAPAGAGAAAGLAVELPDWPTDAPAGATLAGVQPPLFDPPPTPAAIAPKPARSETAAIGNQSGAKVA